MPKRAGKRKEALKLLDEGYKRIEELERNLVNLVQQATDADSESAGGAAPGAALRGAQIREAFDSLRGAYLATTRAVLGHAIIHCPDEIPSSEE